MWNQKQNNYVCDRPNNFHQLFLTQIGRKDFQEYGKWFVNAMRWFTNYETISDLQKENNNSTATCWNVKCIFIDICDIYKDDRIPYNATLWWGDEFSSGQERSDV